MMKRAMLITTLTLLFAPASFSTYVLSGDDSFMLNPTSPTMAKPVEDDVKVTRNYPMQPPVIPHKIRGYEVNLQVNKCLMCHSREKTTMTQATMISVTHYMDRDGNFLAQLSPRRYFCNQCHVVQHDTPMLVENNFADMNQMINQRIKRSEKEKE